MKDMVHALLVGFGSASAFGALVSVTRGEGLAACALIGLTAFCAVMVASRR